LQRQTETANISALPIGIPHNFSDSRIVPLDLSSRHRVKSSKGLEQGRLTRPIDSDKAHNFSLRKREVDAAQDLSRSTVNHQPIGG
jgi:hypothetical protein